MTTVLIIDDDPDVLASLRTVLLPSFIVIAAGSAREAMDRLAFQSPDVIVTDVFMPQVDGFDLIEELRRKGSTVPIIAISGGARGIGRPDPLEIAARLGAAATIAKPFRGKDLVNTVRRVLGARETEHGNDVDGR